MVRKKGKRYVSILGDDEEDDNLFHAVGTCGGRRGAARTTWVVNPNLNSRPEGTTGAANRSYGILDQQQLAQQHPDIEFLLSCFPHLGMDLVRDVMEDTSSTGEAAERLAAISSTADDAAGLDNAAEQAPAAAASTSTPADGDVNLWAALPVECQLLVWAHLSLRDVARTARASREFAAHVRATQLAAPNLTVPPGLSCGAIRGMVTAFANTGTVTLTRCISAVTAPTQIAAALDAVTIGAFERKSCVPIHALVLRRCHELQDHHVAQICRSFPGLRRVVVDECGQLTDASLLALAGYTRRGRFAAGADGDPQDDVQLDAYGLQELSFAKCQGFSHRGIVSLLRSRIPAQSLTAVDHSGCSSGIDLNPTGVVRQLTAMHCRQLGKVVIQMPTGAALQSVNLSSCRGLGQAVISASRLTSLNLSGCVSLRQLQLSCTSLRQLQLSQCQKLHDLEVSSAGLHQLQSLNLAGCHCLSAPGFEVLVQQLESLQHASLAGSISLRRLALPAATDLQVLDVSGCHALRSLEIASPKLHTLHAQGCRQLKELSLQSRAMDVLMLTNCAALEQVSLPRLSASSTGRTQQGFRVEDLGLDGCTSLREGVKRELSLAVG